MKKIVGSIILSSSILFAGLYDKEKLPQINLTNKVILKTSTANRLNSLDILQNKLLIADDNKIKIFDINSQELSHTEDSNNIKKAMFSTDASKLIVLTEKIVFIVDAKTYKILSKIKGKYTDFDTRRNILVLSSYYDTSNVFDLNTGAKIGSLTKYRADKAKISPNLKKIAIYNSSKIFIYDITLKNLLNTISSKDISNIEWSDNKHIDVLSKYYGYVKKFNVITSIKTSNELTFKNNHYTIDAFKVLTPNTIFAANDDEGFIYDFKTNKIITKYKLSQKDNITTIDINNGLLAVGYPHNSYVYNTNLKTNTITSQKNTTTPTTPKVITKVVEKPVIVEKKVVVEKKVYVESHKNIKPTVDIFASKTTGYAPLNVKFKIIANDEDGKIVSYYINLAGKEAIGKGNPKKSFSYTFSHPGNYNIMIAVKDNKGAIATKKITIKVREESFEDYKKGLMGN